MEVKYSGATRARSLCFIDKLTDIFCCGGVLVPASPAQRGTVRRVEVDLLPLVLIAQATSEEAQRVYITNRDINPRYVLVSLDCWYEMGRDGPRSPEFF